MQYVKQKLIKPNKLELRKYQEAMLKTSLEKNTLCCLPTGLGKTPIAIMLAAYRLTSFPESKIMVLAPTKPLVNQHYKSFLDIIEIEKENFQLITGEIKPEKRAALYEEKKIIFATPQTVQHDLKEKRFDFKDFSLLVVDEIHHSIGGYAYPYVSEKYLKQAKNPKILGLTASPGGTNQKIQEICRNTGIEAIEIKTEIDDDVTPYIQEKKVEWIKVELPASFLEIKALLDTGFNKRIESLKKMGFLKGKRVNKRDLLELQSHLIKSIKEGYKKGFWAISITTQAIKIEHALGLLETQGIRILQKYWQKVKKETSAAAKNLVNDRKISNAIWLTNNLFKAGSRHPKIAKLCSIITQQLRENPNSKIIIFANFRETVREIASVLKNINGAHPIDFVGQKEGVTQKQQVGILNDFKAGKYNILVSTSVGEEGIDIPEMQLAIFYEPVPSEIRSIQRRGRVGRTKIGKVVFLITQRTRDEAYYFVAKYKEKKMRTILHEMKNSKKKQGLERFL